MYLSCLDLYTIGIGPSSSHTVGPMRAARQFILEAAPSLVEGAEDLRLQVELYGSLAMTGKGHGTDRAVLAGLQGWSPESVDPDALPELYDRVKGSKVLDLPAGEDGQNSIRVPFDLKTDLIFNRRQRLPEHPNGMVFRLFRRGELVLESVFFSIGGGFILRQGETSGQTETDDAAKVPYPFSKATELIQRSMEAGLKVSEIVLANEQVWHAPGVVEKYLDAVWSAMQACIRSGCEREDGSLPGGLKVQRRAPRLARQLAEVSANLKQDGLTIMDWVNLSAIAVNEENASGGRVVTAPTNGAAGIIPAVMYYAANFIRPESGWHRDFLLTAAAIGMLFKENASISGADVGCQGEVGVACSMAAGALTEILGGSPDQVENAAEIGMEHNLGLTCDPIGGLVQIPCIERNAMGAVKAINAARLAMNGDGQHKVSLDNVIRTMRQTGRDMHRKYKETSRGGLAVNVTEC